MLPRIVSQVLAGGVVAAVAALPVIAQETNRQDDKQSVTVRASVEKNQEGKHEGKIVDIDKGKLTMTDMDGKNKHTHAVPADAKVTLDGKRASLEDLKKGHHVEIMMSKREGREMVTSVTAHSKAPREVRGRAYGQADARGTSRASKIIGATVKNTENENLGKIEDIVLDPHSGNIRYAVLSFGGFLGLGDKLFAIPWRALRMHQNAEDRNEFHFVLNVDKERLKDAPGFDKSKWPDVGNPDWAAQIDVYYHDGDDVRDDDRNRENRRNENRRDRD